jgi:hypothetical protein
VERLSLKIQNLSDLLGAAIIVFRPGIGICMALSAIIVQNIDVYIFMDSGIYTYKVKNLVLNSFIEGTFSVSL